MKKYICLVLALFLLGMNGFAAPSDWAQAEIEESRETIGIWTFESGWQGNTTRAEFARMAVAVVRLTLVYTEWDLRAYTDRLPNKVASYKDENSVFRIEKTENASFTDTDDRYVLLAADMGIVEGRGDGTFDPDGFITRQEAALMLLRTYAAYSETVSFAPEADFSDAEEIASWANLGVRFAVENGVMQGVGENRFDPEGFYTHEQTVITFHRLAKIEKWKETPSQLAATWAIYEASRKEQEAIEAAKTMEDHVREYEETEWLRIDNKWETPYGILLYMHTGGIPHSPTYSLVLCSTDNKTYGLTGPVPPYSGWGSQPALENIQFSEDMTCLTFEVSFDSRAMYMMDTEKVLHEAGTYYFKTDLSIPETVQTGFAPKEE